MGSDTLIVKNMVCHRCVLSVKEILKSSGIPYHEVLVGEIHLCNSIDDKNRKELKEKLEKIGLELIDSRVGELIEKIKQLVIKKARNEVDDTEGRTIENFFIMHRIEKAKELLVYGHLSLSEIAFELDYSSVAHLSSQFKKITGLNPSHFKEIGVAKRKALDQV